MTQELRGRRRRAWFDAYAHDVVSREALRPLADVRLEAELRTVLRLLAARTAGELVVTGIAQDADIGRPTAANYVGLLQALYLVVALPAWSSSHTTRAKRRSKVVLPAGSPLTCSASARPTSEPTRTAASQARCSSRS